MEEHIYYEYLEEFDERGIFELFRDGEPLFSNFINPSMYKQALTEFTKYGKFMRFPTKYVYQWMGIIMENTAKMRATSAISGKYEFVPIYEFIDVFFEDDNEKWEEYKNEIGEEDDYNALWEYLDDNGFDEWCRLTDGSFAATDYGIAPLEKLIAEYRENITPEEVIVLVNKCIDVTHCNGDLSSMFIKGGKKVLWSISNENKEKNGLILSENDLYFKIKECVNLSLKKLGLIYA